jgi:hypothetical protein
MKQLLFKILKINCRNLADIKINCLEIEDIPTTWKSEEI